MRRRKWQLGLLPGARQRAPQDLAMPQNPGQGMPAWMACGTGMRTASVVSRRSLVSQGRRLHDQGLARGQGLMQGLRRPSTARRTSQQSYGPPQMAVTVLRAGAQR